MCFCDDKKMKMVRLGGDAMALGDDEVEKEKFVVNAPVLERGGICCVCVVLRLYFVWSYARLLTALKPPPNADPLK